MPPYFEDQQMAPMLYDESQPDIKALGSLTCSAYKTY